MSEWFRFPDPVNDVSARLVAGGVVLLTLTILIGQFPWLMFLLAFGFLARVATGPRISPLALLVTRVIEPRLGIAPRLTPGPPKRFAQGIGATLSTAAVALYFLLDLHLAAYVLVGMVTVAASLESFAGFCLGCWLFALLMRAGLIPESVCEACADINRRRTVA